MRQNEEEYHEIVDPGADFAAKQALLPDFDHYAIPAVTKQPNPAWQYGDGVENDTSPSSTEAAAKHREIDPYAADRPMINNYKLLIASIAPRPIGLLSTVSADGKTKNLAPFSYFQIIDHDPPTFVIGFSSQRGRTKDTYSNLWETGEGVINTVSESMIAAVNATSIDAPHGVSEWDISGLHEAPTTTVRPGRVRESILSIESKVLGGHELSSAGHQRPGMSAAGIVLLKATRFWVREDATNADASDVALDKLRPIAQLGGLSYGRISSTFELPRKRWAAEMAKSSLLADLDTPKTSEKDE